jgi:tellurite resistance protein TehA-like permease
MFITIKRILFSFILVILNYFIATSQFLFILLIISLILILWKIKPYKEKIFYYRDILVEITFIVIHSTSLALYKEIAKRKILGEIVVYCCWTILASYTICLIYETIKVVKCLFQNKKNLKNNKKFNNISSKILKLTSKDKTPR